MGSGFDSDADLLASYHISLLLLRGSNHLLYYEQGAVTVVGLNSGKVRAIQQVDAVPPLAVSGKHPFLTITVLSPSYAISLVSCLTYDS